MKKIYYAYAVHTYDFWSWETHTFRTGYEPLCESDEFELTRTPDPLIIPSTLDCNQVKFNCCRALRCSNRYTDKQFRLNGRLGEEMELVFTPTEHCLGVFYLMRTFCFLGGA